MPDSKITTDSCDAQGMSYYLKLRETIHGMDKLIVTSIHQCVTMITASLTLAILLYEKIENPAHSILLASVLVVIAIVLTHNSQRRVKLYSDILTQNVLVAGKLEKSLIPDESHRITHQIEENVDYAGMEGEGIFLRSIKVFYAIEVVLILYLLVNTIIMLSNNQNPPTGDHTLRQSVSVLGGCNHLIS